MNGKLNGKFFLIGLGFMLFALTVPAYAEIQIQEQARWGYGPVYAVKAAGNYLYAGEGSMFGIWNISQPANPVKISTIDIKSAIWSLYLEGNYVYVGADNGISIVDVTDRTKPAVLGVSSQIYHDAYRNARTYSAKDIVVKNGRAYVAADGYGFVVYDVSNKSNPVEIGWMINDSLGVDLQNNLAYVSGYGDVKIIDISNPGSLIVKSSWTVPADKSCRNRLFGIKLAGNYAYVAQYGYGVYALNISNPLNPVQAGYVGNPSGDSGCGEAAYKIDLQGNTAYVSWWYTGLVAIDITNPANMVKRVIPSSLAGPLMDALGYNMGVSVNGGYVYMGGQYKGISIFDVSNAPNETMKKIIEPRYGRTFGTIRNGNYLYLGQDGYLVTLDVSDPGKPAYLNEEVYGGRGGGMAINGRYLYHTTGWAPLMIYDIANPAKPAIIKKWSSRINGGPYYVGGRLHVAQDDVYEILNVSDPNNVVVLGSYTATGLSYGGFRSEGQYTYIVANDQFQIFDISNPAKISLTGSLTVTKPAYETSISIFGDYAYIKSGYDDIAVINIADKARPKLEKLVPFKIIHSIVLHRNYLVVSGLSATRVYNLSVSPVNLTHEKEFDFTGTLALTDENLYLCWGYDGPGVTIYAHNLTQALSDTVPPGQITTLTAGSPTANSVVLSWTAAGDDGNSGAASQYDIRYGNAVITESNWTTAAQVSGEPVPAISGTNQTYSVQGLSAGATYYFAIKAADEVSNWSAVSNSPKIITPVQNTNRTPNAPAELVQTDGSGNSIGSMQWISSNRVISSFALTDPDVSDTVKYHIQATSITTAGNADWTKVFINYTSPLIPQGTTNYRWAELKDTATYWWRIWSEDNTGAASSISSTIGGGANVAELTPGSGGGTWGAGIVTQGDPYNTYYQDTRAQSVYLASELISAGFGAGNITGIQLHCNQQPGRDLTDVRIRMRSTANTVSTVWLNDGWTVVYGPATIPKTSIAAGAWNTYTFTTPFYWNGVSNIMIDVTRDAALYTQGGGIYVRTGLTGRTRGGMSDSGYIWPFDDISPVYNHDFVPEIKIMKEGSAAKFGYSGSSDTTAPAQITTLTAGSPTENSIVLSWMSTGDDGNSGTAAQYDIRYASAAITASNWAAARQVSGEPAPAAADSLQLYTVQGLSAGTTYYFAIKAADEASNWSAVSNSPKRVTLVLPVITVTSPNGGQSYAGGSQQTVTWTSAGAVGNVNIDISTNAGDAWTTLAANTPNDGSQAVIIPNTPSVVCRIRVREPDGSPSDTSDSNFTITAAPVLTYIIVSPSAATIVVGGSQAFTATAKDQNGNAMPGITIAWTSSNTGIATVNASGVAAGVAAGAATITAASGGKSGSAALTVNAVPAITVTSPNGGQSYAGGSQQTVTWTSAGAVGNVNIDISTNAGDAWTTLAANTPNDGSQAVIMPNTASAVCRIRVREPDGSPSDTSDGNFTITVSGYKISGNVQIYRCGSGTSVIGGVMMKLYGKAGISYGFTGADGNYEFAGLAGGDYTITAVKSNWRFWPGEMRYTGLQGNKSGQNFVGMPLVVVSPVGGPAQTSMAVTPIRENSSLGSVISVLVPEGAFKSAANLTLTAIEAPASDRASMKVVGYGVSIVSDKSQQPVKGITITMTYDKVVVSGYKEEKLVVGRYDEVNRRWIALPTTRYPSENKVVGLSDHLSRFALLELLSAEDLSAVKAYPNPYNPAKHPQGMKLEGLTAGAVVKIYTVVGGLIRELQESGNLGSVVWDGKNESGKVVASGVYIAHIKGATGVKKVKIAVEK